MRWMDGCLLHINNNNKTDYRIWIKFVTDLEHTLEERLATYYFINFVRKKSSAKANFS